MRVNRGKERRIRNAGVNKYESQLCRVPSPWSKVVFELEKETRLKVNNVSVVDADEVMSDVR